MPESPRWLIAVGKFQEATKVLRAIARVNGRSMPQDFCSGISKRQTTLTTESNYGVLDLFRTPNMRRKTIIITLIWFANTSVYVGLSYYAPSIGGDEIWNFFLAGAVELPTYILLWPGLCYFGRRWILCASMLCGGLACLLTFFYVQRPQLMLLLYCIGKMGISSAFVVLPLLASELYPTVVRGLGMSFSSVIAMIGPIIIPIINHLGQHMLVLPLLVMGTLLIIGGFASLCLPETRGQHLPQTIEDSEAVPLRCYFTYCCCFRIASQAKRNFNSPKRVVGKSSSSSSVTSYISKPAGKTNTNPNNNNNQRSSRIVCSICKHDIQNIHP